MKDKYWGGIFLILLGVLFLLNNFNLVPFDFWGQIWKLWPLFLIIPGIKLLFRKNEK